MVATAQPFRWNAAYGYEWDCFADTGFYHVGAREYDPRTARWLQRDPIDAASGDPNLYRYCGNDPVNFADPTGAAPNWVHTTLDVAGFIPVVGEAADLVNAGLYALDGDWTNAGISALGMLPLLGDAAKAGRLGHKALKLLDDLGDASKAPRTTRSVSDASDNCYEKLKYKVGFYEDLVNEKKGVDGLEAHHVPQKRSAQDAYPDYNPQRAPAINLPKEVHRRIPHRRGSYTGTLDELIAEDISNLRKAGIPEDAIENLIELINDWLQGKIK